MYKLKTTCHKLKPITHSITIILHTPQSLSTVGTQNTNQSAWWEISLFHRFTNWNITPYISVLVVLTDVYLNWRCYIGNKNVAIWAVSLKVLDRHSPGDTRSPTVKILGEIPFRHIMIKAWRFTAA